jgi:hypothetical protein
MKKIIIIVTLLVIGGSAYFFVNRGMEENESKVVAPTSTSANEAKDVRLVGKWETAGNDFEYTSLTLDSDGSFDMNGYFVQYPDKPYVFTGSWKTSQNQNETYLNLVFDTQITVPSTNELVENYRSWGQEFLGNNEVQLKLAISSGEITFHYDGSLMLKKN